MLSTHAYDVFLVGYVVFFEKERNDNMFSMHQYDVFSGPRGTNDAFKKYKM